MQIFEFWGRKGVNINFDNPNHIRNVVATEARHLCLMSVIGSTGRPVAVRMKPKKVKKINV